jgi:hypothetical protein
MPFAQYSPPGDEVFVVYSWKLRDWVEAKVTGKRTGGGGERRGRKLGGITEDVGGRTGIIGRGVTVGRRKRSEERGGKEEGGR